VADELVIENDLTAQADSAQGADEPRADAGSNAAGEFGTFSQARQEQIGDASASQEEAATLDAAALLAEPSTEAAPQVSAELKAIVEALIFASPDPLTPKVLFKILAEEPKEDITAAVAAL
jgi:hypothetical protein